MGPDLDPIHTSRRSAIFQHGDTATYLSGGAGHALGLGVAMEEPLYQTIGGPKPPTARGVAKERVVPVLYFGTSYTIHQAGLTTFLQEALGRAGA